MIEYYNGTLIYRYVGVLHDREYYNGTLIYRYVGVLRNLDACYDQMLHPQKRILVRYNIYNINQTNSLLSLFTLSSLEISCLKVFMFL